MVPNLETADQFAKSVPTEDFSTSTRGNAIIWGCWVTSVFAFGLLSVWIIQDGRFPEAAGWLKRDMRSILGQGTFDTPYELLLARRVWALRFLCATMAASSAAILAGLYFGPARHRGLRSWLALTLLVAVALALWSAWPELAWRGQVHRFGRHLSELDSAAAQLLATWPTGDGESATLGPFLAYPTVRPTTLLMLNRTVIPETAIAYSQVEQSGKNVLRYALAGNDPGAWLEWHADGGRPESFVGGLLESHTIDRFAPLGRDWFLVRYK